MVDICGFLSVAYSVNVRQLGSGYLKQSKRTIFKWFIIHFGIISLLGVSLELSAAFLVKFIEPSRVQPQLSL